jgi:hypothetical protein
VSAAFELIVATYILIGLEQLNLDHLRHTNRIIWVFGLVLVCYGCWFVIIADAVRAAFR